ncbi:calcium-binding protein CP1-like [Magnolia sinica]|uniref:calcium-binding protein CP1-like n=1 Tax=Magnolia sinica TaxID=86752 RepID=UPI0026597ABE|nr:calcium-binding protein CP1-like [Magnolia sinica]
MCPSGRYPRSESDTGSDFRPAFDVLDTDRDGKISSDDLRAFYTGFAGAGATEDDIGSMISIADSNKDGFVEFDEFERVLDCGKTSPGNGVMEDVFRVMDRDGDGKVGFDDLKSYMNWAGFITSDDDIKAMIRMGGGNEEGVCYEGLMKILTVDLGAGSSA